jgi:hypothetical protein
MVRPAQLTDLVFDVARAPSASAGDAFLAGREMFFAGTAIVGS